MVTVASSLRSSKPDDLPGYELREKSEKRKDSITSNAKKDEPVYPGM